MVHVAQWLTVMSPVTFMHFLKAAFITAAFFAGFVVGKDLALNLLVKQSASSGVARAAA